MAADVPEPSREQFDAGDVGGLESLPAGLTVAAVARRLGVAPATLRTWDRRYGVGPSAHHAGAHRRYGPDDVARLTVMRRLVLEGLPPGEAARTALARAVRADAARGTAAPDPTVETPRGGGGSRSIALPDAQPAARGLARAALAHDAAECSSIVARALVESGVVATWDSLVVPVLTAIGRRWEATGVGVDVEHLLSEAVLGALRAHAARQGPPAYPRPVVLACAEDEQHALPVHALATALAERRVAARMLGARMPRSALAEAVRRIGPASVFIWSQLDITGRPEQLAGLPTLRPPVPVVLGGPGWHRDRLAPGAHLVSTLAEAVDALVATAGG